ncbi:MAG: metallophosphoesterase [Prevotella sp.]|jgi:predicted phosphodiesterase|nr:metallophosphoesterase [Prevotella sp.]
MTIQYASDLHLEFAENSKYLEENPIVPVADILILAGDIGYINHKTYDSHPFWDWASTNFKQVLVIPGNHEFYGGYDLSNLKEGTKMAIRENIHWYYNALVVIDDVEFLLTPLWSKINPHAELIIKSRIADFKYIKCNGERLTPAIFNKMHRDCVDFLKSVLKTPSMGKRIIVTHHVPTPQCMDDKFKGSILNGAFVAELDDLILNSGVEYWIYGHSHRNVNEVMMGSTKLLCNQLGYVSHRENWSFRNYMQIIL